MEKVPFSELNNRMDRLRAHMDSAVPDWQAAIVLGKVNMYYLTGTMQDGLLLIPRAGEAVFWVRRSLERALEESLFPDIRPMESYRDAAAGSGKFPQDVYLETEIIPLALYDRLQKYFQFTGVKPLDPHLSAIRAVKSSYELELMRKSGEIHRRVLEERVPLLLKVGISEADFTAQLYAVLVEEGHHGVSRFGMFGMEAAVGQVGFGDSSIYPTFFNGPGGNRSSSLATPFQGSRERKLAPGDLVFIDVGCGVDGYHTDKTLVYAFGRPLPDEALAAHRRCVDIQNEIANMLIPGETPERIYKTVLAGLDADFQKNFMGFGDRRVKFLGHGIGLLIDELPVIAEGFREPLREGMAFAVEPKKGIAGVGMVGIENTFLVAPGGGKCITGNLTGSIAVY